LRRIQLLYFAALRERMGTGAEEVDLPGEVTDVRALRAWLEANRPQLRGVLGSVRVAVGDEFAALDRPLGAGEVVALLPPVSGG
jgi:molybdopterin synthase sulfur carrier subunit